MEPPIQRWYLNKWIILVFCCIIAVLFLVVLDFQLYEVHKPKEGSVSIIAQDPQKERITFEQALGKLAPNNADFAMTQLSENFSVRYVMAKQVDIEGRSVVWLFGVKEGNNCNYYSVSREATSRQPGMCVTLPETSIPVRSIKSPADIISSHRNLILDSLHIKNATIDSIIISKTNITLVQQNNGNIQSLIFNSENGELIQEF